MKICIYFSQTEYNMELGVEIKNKSKDLKN
jgi:hypothetical protein